MEKDSKGVAWFGDICRKFEAVCLEVEDAVWQEGFKYVEDQVQTIGANVEQFCSQLVQEMLPQSSVKETAACDSCLTKSCEKVDKISDDSIVGDSPEKDSSEEGHFVFTCSQESFKVAQPDFLLEDDVDALMSKQLETGMTGRSSQAKHLDLEMSDKITSEGNDPSFPLFSPAFGDVIKSKTVILHASSNSTDIADSCNSESLDGKLLCGDSLFESTRKDAPIDVYTLNKSSGKENLDESCILVDGNEYGEISSVSIEVGRSKSFKKKLGAPFISKSRSAKQDWYSEADPRLGQAKVVGQVVSGSSIITSSNLEECIESDWEII